MQRTLRFTSLARRWVQVVVALLLTLSVGYPADARTPRDTVGLVDPTTGLWYLQAEDGGVKSF